MKNNDYFDLIQVSESGYAAISKNPITMSNAGFIDLGNIIVVFDTFLSIDAAKVLKDKVNELNPEKVIVLNSHQHLDHYLGNCVFKNNALFLASKYTKQEIIRFRGKIPSGYDFQDEIDEFTEKLKNAQTQEEIYNSNNSLTLYKNLKHKELEFIDTDLIIENELTVSGTKGELKLRLTDKAHSNGDIVAFLEEEKVAFVGDLLFVDQHPYLGAGDPYNLIHELEKLYESEITTFIPGHGPICGKDKILEQIDYINIILKLVTDNINHTEKISIQDMPEKYRNQNYVTFRWNIDAIAKSMN